MFQDQYRPHDAFIAPARATPELWRLAAGIVLGTVAMIVFGQMIYSTAALFLSEDARAEISANPGEGRTATSAVLLLGSLAALGAAAFFVAQVLHRRGPTTLTGPLLCTVRQFLTVMKGLALLYAVLFLMAVLWDHDGLVRLRPTGEWLALLPLGLVVVLIQSASEEIAFRGYIQQQVAARFGHPLVWLCAPSALFALAHYDAGTFGDHAGMIVLWTFLFGLAAADLTGRSGTIGPAVAMHFTNNAIAVLYAATGETLSGLALYSLPIAPADEGYRAILLLDLAIIGISWLTARVMLRA